MTVVVGDGGNTVAAPVFDPAPGEVVSGTEITITTDTDEAEIYFTVDGSTPDLGTGTLYTGPVILTEDTTLKAIASKEGYSASTVTSGEYTIRLPQIVYISWAYASSSEAAIMNEDGSNPVRLTYSYSNPETTPHFTPDGNKIIFGTSRSGDNGRMQIYSMNRDGSNQINLSNYSSDDRYPSLSPDGSKIVFTTNRDVGINDEIYMMNIDGSNPINLTNTPAIHESDPAFSSDGSMIAFSCKGEEDSFYNVYIMNTDGTGRSNLTNDTVGNIYMPCFSPSEDKIVFFSSGEIYSMNIDGSNVTNLTNNPASDWLPYFSPNGEKIAFFSNRPSGAYDIWIMNSDGSDQTQLTVDCDPQIYDHQTNLSFSADGKIIVFTATKDGNMEIYTVDTETGTTTRLTNSSEDDGLPVFE